ncbi:MAG: hypothetical protein MJK14_26100, partial [Rivularia sp. ALOHA_DT_140]|nr:hypothetical protein [Rivularia sp. ALOHA_DT_140]
IGTGDAGSIKITTDKLTLNDNSKATVSSAETGESGFISIDAKQVNLANSAKISATTKDGDSGSLSIDAEESVNLDSASSVIAEATGIGKAGDVSINTPILNIDNNAFISVSSKLGQAGNLEITADNLFLTQGMLTAETGIGDSLSGANITLNIQDLLWMQYESFITAEAFDTANGGNITINNPEGFVIGLKFENSDISANATQGNGGNIDITTQNIFGLVFREARSDKSDITASSQFGVNGQVTINQLNVNPASGLVELPSSLVGTNGIKASCAASRGNNFIVSGKGGLSQSPDDLFSGYSIYTDLFDLVQIQKVPSNRSNDSSSFDNQNNKIVEATGWITDADGNVFFVAKMPENNSQHSVASSVNCEDFSAVGE